MSSFKYPVFPDRILATEIASVLEGTHLRFPQDWLKARWIQHAAGFKLLASASVPPGMKLNSSNPRLSGTWSLVVETPDSNTIVAYDYIMCNGKMSCTKIDDHCGMKFRISYYADGSCVLLAQNLVATHGLNFKSEPKLLRMTARTKLSVDKYVFLVRPNLQPSNVRRIMLSETPLYRDNPSLVPTVPMISDYIYRSRIKKRKNVWEHCADLMKDYPDQILHHPEEGEPRFALFRSPKRLFESFCANVSSSDSVVGLDAQFKNNYERMPVWVISSQDDDYHTIPGFVIVGESSNAKILTSAIAKVVSYLSEQGKSWKATTMLDKDKLEWKSLLDNGLKFIMCEFHVVKA